MVYVNKPKPSKGFVSLILAFLVFLGVGSIINYIITFNSNTSNITFGSIIIAIFGSALIAFGFLGFTMYSIGQTLLLSNVKYWILVVIPLLIFGGISIHAAYNTEYRIEDGKLWMKFGHIKNGFVSLDEIKCIKKVDFISGTWRLNPNYCNRFKNGVGIITENKTIWLSPEDSEEFISKLRLK